MTYPPQEPQGPYGQQPDPYGQQPQYGQHGGGFQAGQYGGLGGPPPKKNTGPIIAVVAIVVLLLGGLGITGFVAPGFFLSDDEGTSNTGSGGNQTSERTSTEQTETSTEETEIPAPTGGGGPVDGDHDGVVFIQGFVEAINRGNAVSAKEMLCTDSDSAADVDEHAPTTSLQVIPDSASNEIEETHVWLDMTATVSGEETTAAVSAFLEEQGWCVYIFSVF